MEAALNADSAGDDGLAGPVSPKRCSDFYDDDDDDDDAAGGAGGGGGGGGSSGGSGGPSGGGGEDDDRAPAYPSLGCAEAGQLVARRLAANQEAAGGALVAVGSKRARDDAPSGASSGNLLDLLDDD